MRKDWPELASIIDKALAAIPEAKKVGILNKWMPPLDSQTPGARPTEWDLYFYLNVRPWSWWITLTIAGVIAAAYLLLAAWLYTRWLFAIPILIFEDATPVAALRKSWQLTRGRFRELVLPLAICWIVIFTLSLATTWLVSAAAAQLLNRGDLTLKVVVPTVAVTLAFITLLDIMWFIIGKIVHVMLMVDFYREFPDAEHRISRPTPAAGMPSPGVLKGIGGLIAAGVLIIGIVFRYCLSSRLQHPSHG